MKKKNYNISNKKSFKIKFYRWDYSDKCILANDLQDLMSNFNLGVYLNYKLEDICSIELLPSLLAENG